MPADWVDTELILSWYSLGLLTGNHQLTNVVCLDEPTKVVRLHPNSRTSSSTRSVISARMRVLRVSLSSMKQEAKTLEAEQVLVTRLTEDRDRLLSAAYRVMEKIPTSPFSSSPVHCTSWTPGNPSKVLDVSPGIGEERERKKEEKKVHSTATVILLVHEIWRLIYVP